MSPSIASLIPPPKCKAQQRPCAALGARRPSAGPDGQTHIPSRSRTSLHTIVQLSSALSPRGCDPNNAPSPKTGESRAAIANARAAQNSSGRFVRAALVCESIRSTVLASEKAGCSAASSDLYLPVRGNACEQNRRSTGENQDRRQMESGSQSELVAL